MTDRSYLTVTAFAVAPVCDRRLSRLTEPRYRSKWPYNENLSAPPFDRLRVVSVVEPQSWGCLVTGRPPWRFRQVGLNKGQAAESSSMITTLHFGTAQVSDFRALVESFRAETFASPLRSTVPLLDFWRVPELRLEEFSRTIGIERIDSAKLFFEFPVPVRRGRGKPSFTDLLILGENVAIAVEAKFTEPPYQDVRSWLGPTPTVNRIAVLEGWLELAREVTGCRMERADVPDLPYQLIHRTASACSLEAPRRIVVYQTFGGAVSSHYIEALSALLNLVGADGSLGFRLVRCAFQPSPEWTVLKARWESRESGLAEPIRRALLRDSLFSFASLTREDVRLPPGAA